jgi:hypothetical protein
MSRQRGASAIETLVAIPVLLFVGLGALQFALIFHARQALNLAVLEGARSGSVSHAAMGAIDTGIARGLVPFLYGASDTAEYLANVGRAVVHVQAGLIQGWLRVERLSPNAESFSDWAEPALDPAGVVMPGRREIPNDNLASRAELMQPLGGVGGWRGAEPIGRLSRQTLADANLLKIELTYGVPAYVPVVGRLLAWSLRTWGGCAAAQGRSYGALTIAAPESIGVLRRWPCSMFGADANGAVPRVPVTVRATVRMQSPARP